jgi:hypothetical protein
LEKVTGSKSHQVKHDSAMETPANLHNFNAITKLNQAMNLKSTQLEKAGVSPKYRSLPARLIKAREDRNSVHHLRNEHELAQNSHGFF